MSKDNKAIPTAPAVISTIAQEVVGSNPFPADQELVSIGFAKVPGTRDWQAYTLTTKAGKVTKMVLRQCPDFKASTIEWAKQAFNDAFMGDQ